MHAHSCAHKGNRGHESMNQRRELHTVCLLRPRIRMPAPGWFLPIPPFLYHHLRKQIQFIERRKEHLAKASCHLIIFGDELGDKRRMERVPSEKQMDPCAPIAKQSHHPGDGGAKRFPAAVLSKIESKSEGKAVPGLWLTLRRLAEYSGLC